MKLSERIGLDLDKTTWTLTRLGDLASDVNDRIATPSESVHNRFVGLEHFVSGDLKIKSWKTTEGLVSAAKKFQSGDILFARRNAYLKRASMVDFDGVCSGDAFVIRENHERVAPGFLSFVMNSEKLWRYAISNAAGTMSKRVKWRDLANYEFLLPPKDQQAKLAELLWAGDDSIQSSIGALPKLDKLRRRILENHFSHEEQYSPKTLGELVRIRSGDSPSNFTFTDEAVGVPFHKVKDLNESVKYQDYAKEWVIPIENKLIPAGSVIFPKRGASIMTNKVRITNKLCHVDTNTMALTVKNPDNLSTDFLYYFLLYKELFRIADTSQIPQINNVHINPFRIHLPPIEVQKALLKELDTVLELSGKTHSHLQAQNALFKSLINQIF